MEVSTKHRERDAGLLSYRSQLLARIIQDLTADPHVRAVFLGGSLATGDDDRYSDVDLRVVVDPEQLSVFVQKKKERAAIWGTVLFYEDRGSAITHTVAQYSGFLKVDCFYYAADSIAPSLFLQQIRIPHDPTGLMHCMQQQSRRLRYQLTSEEVERWRYKGLAVAHEIYRGCLRGDFSYARTMLMGLAGYAVVGWHMEAGRLPDLWAGASKREGPRAVLNLDQQELLRRWQGDRTDDRMLATMADMVPELSRLNRVLSQKVGCDAEAGVWQKAWALVR